MNNAATQRANAFTAYSAYYTQNPQLDRVFNQLNGGTIGGAPLKNLTRSLYDHAIDSMPYDTQDKKNKLIYAVQELNLSRGADPKNKDLIKSLYRKAHSSSNFNNAELSYLSNLL